MDNRTGSAAEDHAKGTAQPGGPFCAEERRKNGETDGENNLTNLNKPYNIVL